MEITFHINLTIQDERKLSATLARIERNLDAILALEIKEMAAIDTLEAAVAKQTTVIGGATKLLADLSALIKSAGTDPAKLDAITKHLDDNTDALAAAVAANTPASSEPAPAPLP